MQATYSVDEFETDTARATPSKPPFSPRVGSIASQQGIGAATTGGSGVSGGGGGAGSSVGNPNATLNSFTSASMPPLHNNGGGGGGGGAGTSSMGRAASATSHLSIGMTSTGGAAGASAAATIGGTSSVNINGPLSSGRGAAGRSASSANHHNANENGGDYSDDFSSQPTNSNLTSRRGSAAEYRFPNSGAATPNVSNPMSQRGGGGFGPTSGDVATAPPSRAPSQQHLLDMVSADFQSSGSSTGAVVGAAIGGGGGRGFAAPSGANSRSTSPAAQGAGQSSTNINNTTGTKKVAGTIDTYVSVEEELRHTPEYKLAWDLEVWRLVQRQKIEKECKEYRKKLHDDAKSTLLAQEREIKRELERAVSDLAAKEKAFEEEERKQDRRKTKLLEAEREIERKAGLLIEQRKRIEEEAEQRVRRAKAEYDHKEELSLQRVQTLQDTAKRAEQRLEASQKEYLKLWEEFADFRTRTLTNAPSEGVGMERLRAQHSSEMMLLQERLERNGRDAIMDITRRLEASNSEGAKLSSSLAQKKEQLKQYQRENTSLVAKIEGLEQQVERLTQQLRDASSSSSAANNSGRSAAGSSGGCHMGHDEVAALRTHVQRTVQRELAASGLNKSGSGGGGSSPAARRSIYADASINGMGVSAAADGTSSSPTSAKSTLMEQLARWRGERVKLLEMAGGAYDEESTVIVALDANIRRAQERLAALGGV